VWLDKWHLIPGDPWQPAIEKALAKSETCAVFIGSGGIGPWQNEEMRAAIDRHVVEDRRLFRVIPVLLPGAKRAERSSLPTFLAAMAWVEFRDSLDDANAFHRLVCGIRGVEPGAGPGQTIYKGQCPYRGLRVFDVDDAAFFFGREALTQWLLNELRPAAEGQPVNRFLAIVGASGSGKSSVARAGLVAALRRDDISTSSRWPVAIFRPGPDPVESLAVARRLTLRGYKQIGGLEGAVQRRAETTLAAFSQGEKELCRRTFLRLIQPGEGSEDVKRRASMRELLSLSKDPKVGREIVQKLANASLLTIADDLSHEDAFVELAHEALIRGWPQLRNWINADRAGLRTRTRLSESVLDWENSGKDPTYLYIGARLAVAKEWAASHPGELSKLEEEFLVCSLKAQSDWQVREYQLNQLLAKADERLAQSDNSIHGTSLASTDNLFLL
jgi:TIR domain